MDRNGKLIKKWGEIPTERKDDLQKYPYAFGYGWRSFIDYSPNTGTLVAATQFGEVLEVWNVKKDTYKKIFRNENFDKVISNIKYIASLKQKGLVKNFCLQFVITRDNYKEIKEFIKFANSVNAIPVFTFVIKNDETEYCKNYYNYSVHEKEHYLYNSFVSVLQDPFVQKNIPEHLKKYQKISQFLIIKNWFRYIMNKRKEV